MTTYYVWSGAAGTGTGASWANAFTTLQAGLSASGTGNTLYVAHDHAQSGSAPALTSNGAYATPVKVICVDRGGTVPPVAADKRATATVASTTNTNLNISGFTHYDGIIFNCGSGVSSSASLIVHNADSNWMRFDNCSLRLVIAAGSSRIYLGGVGNFGTTVDLNNTTIAFGTTGHQLLLSGVVRWRNTPSAIVGGVIPTTVFSPYNGGQSGLFECIGVDLSAVTSGTLCLSTGAPQSFRYRFLDCKVDAGATKAAAPGDGMEVDFIRTGTSGVNYTLYHRRKAALLIEETTIVRTGGATDGTTPIAWNVATTANCTYSKPFESPPIAIWNDTTGSAKTATVECVWGGGAVPLDSEIWLDVEYLGSSSSPQGSFVNDGTADLLTTAANQTSSSATWGGSTTKFKLNVTFTPQQKGWVYARVKCAKASTTFYIDPLVTLT